MLVSKSVLMLKPVVQQARLLALWHDPGGPRGWRSGSLLNSSSAEVLPG